MNKYKEKGFTLIELLIVIGIIAILASVVITQSEYTESITPTLTTPTGTSTGETTADGSVETDQDNGSLYWVTTTSSTSPTKTQVKNGQDHNSDTATDSGSQTVSASGTQSVSASGLTADTTYHFHFMHESADATQSDVASSGSLTTAAPFSCASAGQGEHTVDGDTIYCDGSDNMWTPTLDLPADGTNDQGYEWGCYETELGCASSTTDGEANTTCILNNCSETPIAAEQCDNLNYAGETDWYLPAQDTLLGLYNEAGSTPTYDSNAQSAGYWSSTEYSDYSARDVGFLNGYTHFSNKTISFRVRCVRR